MKHTPRVFKTIFKPSSYKISSIPTAELGLKLMSHFPDTSFLCAFYRDQTNSHCADAYVNKLSGGLQVSSLLLSKKIGTSRRIEGDFIKKI